MIDLRHLLIVCPLVFLAGFVDSIAGGGGLLALPAYMLTGLPPHLMLGTNKFSSAAGTLFSTARFIKNRSFDLGCAVPSIVLAFAGSAVGSKLVLMVDETVLKIVLLVCVPPIAAFILWNRKLEKKGRPWKRRTMVILASLISLVIGMYDGFFGPGTGTFLIIAYTSVVGLDLLTSMGNTKLVNLTSNIAALAVFILEGKVLYVLAVPAAACSIAGHLIGSKLAIRSSVKIVRPMLVVVLILLLIKLAWDLLA